MVVNSVSLYFAGNTFLRRASLLDGGNIECACSVELERMQRMVLLCYGLASQPISVG